tara:strand:- start:677 stop:1039 length:363 start_codon:yes stop_codon:yes gene_type:complete
MDYKRRNFSAEQKLKFEARESFLADRSTLEARKKSWHNDEFIRNLYGGTDSARLNVPALTTDDLKQASKSISKLAKNLKDLSDSVYKPNHKIMLMRQAIWETNCELRERKRASQRSYKKP